MSCDEIDKAIRAVFAAIQKQAGENNITDEMVIKSDFNDLNARARQECHLHYSIDHTPQGYVLGRGKV